MKRGAKVADRYRVLRRLGSGGMATVFLAEDERLGREVALKRLSEAAADEELRRLRREARVGAGLNHPNLVAIFDILSTDEGAVIVMEYVPGPTLSQELERGPLPEERALDILRGLAAALDHAHGAGIVHRDVKPGNVMLREDGRVKLTDLGIARAIDDTQITREGQVVGTLPYMAPERFEGPGLGDPESDVYSLAALAFEMLSGRPPKGAGAGEAVSDADLRAEWPQGPPAALAVLAQGLDPAPERRPASAGRLVDDLEEALAQDPPSGTATVEVPRRTAGATPRRRPASGGPSRRAALAVLGGAAVLVLGAIALSSGGGDGEGGDRPARGDGNAGGAQAPSPAESEPADPGDDPALGAQLNDEGFALIQQGRYEEAIPVLERAVAAFPEGTSDINYAYALFNLGNALRLAGRPEEAIPILEQRLEIPNQTGTVQRELELAREEAGE